MTQSIEHIVNLSRDLISLESSDTIRRANTLFVKEGISTLPIINGKRKNLGVIRKKHLWNIVFKGIPNGFYDDSVMNYKENPLPHVTLNDSLSHLLNLLKNESGVLFLNEKNKFTKLITPRVVANAFERYASKFLELQKIEESIRKLLSKISSEDPTMMTFREYREMFKLYWEELGMDSVHKKEFYILFDAIQNHRNEVMHFRLESNQSSISKQIVMFQNLLNSVN